MSSVRKARGARLERWRKDPPVVPAQPTGARPDLSVWWKHEHSLWFHGATVASRSLRRPSAPGAENCPSKSNLATSGGPLIWLDVCFACAAQSA
jgi:hypothetical protein